MSKPILFVITIMLSVPAIAQQPDSTLLESMRTAFRELDYTRAEAVAQNILSTYGAYSVEELIEAHTTIALLKYAQNRQDESRQHFESALSLNGDLELDSLLVSPKIMAFFDDVRTESTLRQANAESMVVVRYMLQEDPRPGAALRSMILPGLGQLYKTERRKGWMIVGAWTGALTATTAAHIARQNARRSYLGARDPSEIADRYDTYNRLHKIRNGLALVATGIWIYGYLDALIGPVVLPSPGPSKTTLTFSPSPEVSYGRLTISYRF